MAFRQQNKNPDTAWRKRIRPQLLAGGMPDFLIDDKRRWTYVLLHGDEFESGWNPSWITKEQAMDMQRLLQSHYTNPIGLRLFVVLEKRIND